MSLEDLYKLIEQDPLNEIDSWVKNSAREHYLIDFKTKRDSSSEELHSDDRANLSKCISAFANSDGGFVIWGISENKKDKTLTKTPIADPERFASNLERAFADVTLPPVSGLKNIVMNEGFVVTFVPKSFSAPHRAIQAKNHYYKRYGEQSKQVEHHELEYMFGVRKAPSLVLKHQIRGDGSISGGGHEKTYNFTIDFFVENQGRKLARYLNFRMYLPRTNKGYKRDNDRRSFIITEGPDYDRDNERDIISIRTESSIVVHPNDRLRVFSADFSHSESQMEPNHIRPYSFSYDLFAQDAMEILGDNFNLDAEATSERIKEIAFGPC